MLRLIKKSEERERVAQLARKPDGPEALAHHQQLLEGYFQSHVTRNHSERTIAELRRHLTGWFKEYGGAERPLYVWEAMEPVMGRKRIVEYGKALIAVELENSTIRRYANVRTVFEFQYWLSQNEPGCGLFTASESIVIRYLHSRNDRDRSGIRRKALGRFYRWAKYARLTLLNPVENIPVPKIQRSLCVCSGEQIAAIEAFVKNSKSDPEYALVLTLALYWGLGTRELAMSSIEIQGEQIWINLYRREMGRWRKSHNRAQVLKLPLDPKWLHVLQKRYIALWRNRFDHARKSLPVQPLILGRAGSGGKVGSNRYFSFEAVLKLFYRATIAATGERIPPNVVRRTSGHIHTHHGDASRLTNLGWSHSMAVYFSSVKTH